MILLSPINTQLPPDTAASTLLRLLKPRLLSLRVGGAWQSLKFDKEYLFSFETLFFATSGILSMHNQLVTLKRERKN